MTELTWDGKYLDGKKAAPVRIALPFQTIETVNETAQDRHRNLDLFAAGRETAWRNRLIWGDKKYVLPSLLPEFAGQVNLIYIDPPFDTGADFSYTATIPDHEGAVNDSASFVKEPSVLEQKAYRDTWGRGLDSYLQWFHETLLILQGLLADTGSIYVHLDWHIGHHAKVVLDEVFGAGRYRAEIVWQKLRSVKSQSGHFASMHDSIFVYSASDSFVFNPQFVEKNPALLKSHYRHTDPESGRRYNLGDFTQAGPGPARRFGSKVISPPPGKHWIWSQERIDEAMKGNLIIFSKGGLPYAKRFFDDTLGTRVGDIWTDVNPVNQVALERLDYPTQKPEALLERIIRASSNEGDLVLDCFVGSGTTAAVGEKLRRRWIVCDLGRFAIHTSRKRLLAIAGVRPFVVQNLGKYERQAWQAAEFAAPGDLPEREQRYRSFILDLYRATPVTGHAWLHGIKNGRMVHVGAVDAPVTLADVKAIASELWRAVGKGEDAPTSTRVDVLGWEFAFELNELARQVAAEAHVDVAFKKIPREVLEKRAVEQGDIRFFELAALTLDVKVGKREVTLKLTDFVIPPDDVPEDVRKVIKHWIQYMDYWAVDWDYKGDTFHNQWQSYRTRENQKLETAATYTYVEPGKYTVVVKVIDILGNDTTKAFDLQVS